VLKRMMMVVAVLVIGVAFQASAGVISTPDSDAFGTDGTPPPGWTNLANTWSASGGVAVPSQNNYSYTIMQRGTPGSDYYEYEFDKKLVISWDMKPDHQGDGTARTFVEFLTPVSKSPVAGTAQESVGYYVMVNKGGTLWLYRDAVNRDNPGSSVGSVSLGSAYNTAMHSYRVEIDYTGGTSADFAIYVDDVERLTYTDPSFMPKAGWNQGGAYSQFEVGMGRGHWPGGPQSPEFDNFQLEFEEPPAPIAEPAGLSLIGLALLGLRKRRS